MRIKLAFVLGPLAPVLLILAFMCILDRSFGAIEVLPVALVLSYAWFDVTGSIIYVVLRRLRCDDLIVCALAGGIAGTLYFIGPFALSGFHLSSLDSGTFLFVALLFVVGAVAGICFRWISGPFKTQRFAIDLPNQSKDPAP
jgi:hypothetical protein